MIQGIQPPGTIVHEARSLLPNLGTDRLGHCGWVRMAGSPPLCTSANHRAPQSNDLRQRRRIYLTGISQGAAFLHIVIARRSERIAAAASHSGWLPDPLGETGVDTKHKCPILFIVGKNDTQVSPQSVAKAHDCFADAGHPTKMLQLEGVGHCWAKHRGINETIWQFLSKHQLP